MASSVLDQIKHGFLFIKHADGPGSKCRLGWYFFRTIPRRLGFRQDILEEISVKLCGVSFHFLSNSCELFSFKEIFMDGIYEKHPLFELKNQKVIFDLGANIGFFTLRAAMNVSDCRIFSFEPHPYVFRRLAKNVRTNNLNNVFAFQCAIGSESSSAKFKMESNTWMSRIIKNNESRNGDCVDVEVITLDDFIIKNQIDCIDLIKIDVEGAEYDVLLGAAKSLDKIRTIVMEYHNHDLLEKVNMLLKN